ncbi:MAG: betaine/proline/choline family ABC transporter ATP-binding protein [Erysipelothrix sp.]|nr:betaine/proline/choline family ABC transporter ATP-binding protein [Erysipelothrix sp.]
MNNIIMKTEHLTKLYGRNKTEALNLLKKGTDKATVLDKTGVTVALYDVNLDIKPGELFVIIGLSGSGKSTLVRCFNRLNTPTRGNVYFKDQALKTLNKEQLIQLRREKIAMVFQHFGLMSHRNVIENVEYGLEVKGMDKIKRKEIALDMLDMVGLKDVETMDLTSLSGGMKQRVGLARALANDPEVLLMDEPFSALDPLVKRDMQFELLKIHQKLKRTIIFITHDINEAFKLGDRVAIMRDGRLIQVDTPENMMSNPADDYVQDFIDGADRSQVMSVRNVMITPSTIVWSSDGPRRAIQEMRANNVPSAYVCDQDMQFQGVITLEGALELQKHKTKVADYMIRDVTTISADATIADVMPIAADTKFPIPVLEDGKLIGIVSKASVIETLIPDSNNNH